MKKRVCFTIAVLLLLALIAWIVWGNTVVQLHEISVSHEGLPDAFDGFRIAQISDLHNAEFGDQNERLLSLLRESEPDIIVLTGDLIDSRRTDVEIALSFVKQAIKIAPLYYVTGNHEFRVPEDYAKLELGMMEAGVCVLHEDTVILEKDGQQIRLAGIDAPNFYNFSEDYAQALIALCDDEEYTVLLSHNPEYFDSYVEAGAELILSGHAHGGQFRLPFLGGMVAPGQGFFPEYDAGAYTSEKSTLVVSRGLGNSLFPFRLNNPPEIVLVELHREPT